MPSGAVRDRAVREALCDPEYHSRIQMGGKGHQLAEVIVLRGFQPVSPDRPFLLQMAAAAIVFTLVASRLLVQILIVCGHERDW